MAAETGVTVYGGAKLVGFLGGAGIGAALSAYVVMAMTRPKTDQEWSVALISTVLSSLCGGAAVTVWLWLDTLRDVIANAEPVVLVMALLGWIGIVFACGLPGWLLVRAGFRWMERQRDKDIAEIAATVRQQIGGGNG